MRQKLLKGPGPVADAFLYNARQLAEGAVVFRNQEVRIVAEAVFATRVADDTSVAGPFGSRTNLT